MRPHHFTHASQLVVAVMLLLLLLCVCVYVRVFWEAFCVVGGVCDFVCFCSFLCF